MKKLLLISFLILFGCGPAISYDMQNSWRDVDEATDEVQAAQPLPPGVLIPPGGSTGQILMKQTDSDGDTYWADAPNGTPPSGCDPTVDFVGYKADSGESSNVTSAGVLRMSLFTPTCTGELDTLYFYRGDSDQAEVEILVYEDNGDELPGPGDTLVSDSILDLGTSSGMKSIAAVAGINLDATKKYWVGALVSPTNSVTFYYDTVTGLTSYYSSNIDWYGNPPSELIDLSNSLPDRGYVIYGSLK